jgi:fatty-acyl-CoA synthase
VLHALSELAFLGIAGMQGRFCRDDVYMPIKPCFMSTLGAFPGRRHSLAVKQVCPGRYDPSMLLKLIKNEGVTFTHGVATILQMLLGAAATAKTDLSGSKMVIGGSALPKALAKQALAAGVDIYAGYGMLETGPIASTRLSDQRTSAAIQNGKLKSARALEWPGRWSIYALSIRK